VFAAAERELQPVYAAALEPVYAADGSEVWAATAVEGSQQQQQQQEAELHPAFAGIRDFFAADFSDAVYFGQQGAYGQQMFVAAAAAVQEEEAPLYAEFTDAAYEGGDSSYFAGQHAHYNSPAYEQLFATGEHTPAAAASPCSSTVEQLDRAAASFAAAALAADGQQQYAPGAAEQQPQQAASAAAAASSSQMAAQAALEPEYQAPASAASAASAPGAAAGAITSPPRAPLPALARALVSVRRTARLLRAKGLDAVNLNRHLDALQHEYRRAAAAGEGAGGGRWQRKRVEAVMAAGERARSLTDVRYELQACVHMCAQLHDPSHPDLLMADRRLAAAAGILATLPSVLPSFGM
jgi:hypothetical protein